MKRRVIYFIFFAAGALQIFGAAQIKQELAEVGSKNNRFEIADCLNRRFKIYAPPGNIREILDDVFKGSSFFELLEEQNDSVSWLKSQGFKIIQFNKDAPFEPSVMEHEQLPGFVIKFMRINAPKTRITRIKRNLKIIPKMSDRVVHAQVLRKKIQAMGLRYVAVPEKYFYCVDDVAVVVARKIVPARTLKDLNGDEIRDILRFVAAAKGIVDTRARNIIITQDKIFFIDTEKKEIPDWWLGEIKRKYWAPFRAAINPLYWDIVDAWAEQQDRKAARLANHKI